jgi:hypothetical protein
MKKGLNARINVAEPEYRHYFSGAVAAIYVLAQAPDIFFKNAAKI